MPSERPTTVGGNRAGVCYRAATIHFTWRHDVHAISSANERRLIPAIAAFFRPEHLRDHARVAGASAAPQYRKECWLRQRQWRIEFATVSDVGAGRSKIDWNSVDSDSKRRRRLLKPIIDDTR